MAIAVAWQYVTSRVSSYPDSLLATGHRQLPQLRIPAAATAAPSHPELPPPARSPAMPSKRTAPPAAPAAPAKAPAPAPASQNPLTILGAAAHKYARETPQRTKLIDAFMGFLVAAGVLQFVYCVVAGNYVRAARPPAPPAPANARSPSTPSSPASPRPWASSC